MANTNAPRGGKVVGRLGGGLPRSRVYYIPSSDSTAVFVGDLVKLAGSADAFGVPTVAQAAAGDAVVGVVTAVDKGRGVTDANFNLYATHRPASVGMYVWVCDDPLAIIEMQYNGTLAAADISLNADVVVGSGDTVTGLSGMQIDNSTKATTNTLALQMLELSPQRGNDLGQYAKVLCRINKHQRANAATGV